MAEAMIGEIRAFPYAYAPDCWLDCDGRLVNIRDYQALFAILGSTYGNYTATQFYLPDLRGRIALGYGQGPGLSYYRLGGKAGTEGVSLTSTSQLPAHNHTLQVQNLGLGQEPPDFTAVPKAGLSYASRYWYNLSQRPPVSYVTYNPTASSTSTTPTSPTAMSVVSLDVYGGGSAPHENRQPYIPLRFCICWNGYFMPNPN